MCKKVLILPFVSFFSIASFAQAPKYSNEFLSIGSGGRALAMSNSVVSSVFDVSSGYWNPAGLLGVKSNMQLTGMHSEWFAGIAKYDYIAGCAPIDSSSALAVSFIRFGVDNIPDTSELIDADGNLNYDKIKSFSAADYAYLFSYAKKSNNHRSGGAGGIGKDGCDGAVYRRRICARRI